MISKKYPESDIHRHTGLIFQLCLVGVLALANLAFEWRSFEKMEEINLEEAFRIENPDLRPPLPADTFQRPEIEVFLDPQP
ncbi:MAG: hypothetical protein OHK0053_34040 [Microscillaceae bacterium]